jgi:triphosphatase
MIACSARTTSACGRKAGAQPLQTIKANSSALVAREEWETEIDRDEPKLELARDTALAPLLTAKLTKQLKPMFETRVERVVIPLHVGDSDIELAFDQGCVATADAKLDLAEIELELKHGDRSEVARLAKKLARAAPVTLSVRAEAELGYALRRQRLTDEHIKVARGPELLGEPFQLSFQSLHLAVMQHILEQR